ncbi:hypothetical protein ACHZ97_09490 [Lysobacter soli]|uniref:hypothetical protein n=1 Tax=Lysobacter soli TaxID=453783 RepID=UPI0037CA6E1F
MDIESVRPIISGVVGGVIATWLTARWARGLPDSYNAKSREYLARHHRTSIWIANALFFAGICFGVALYPLGGFAETDHRPLLWGFGLASVLPLISLWLISATSGRDAKEAFVAFSWGQGSPLWATYGILGAGVVAFVFALASLGG